MKKELKSVKEVSLIFNGMALLGEALAIVVHFFQEDLYKPTQRLIRLEVLAKVLKREELTQRLISCLAVDYNCALMVVIGGCETASVNGAAMRNVKFFYADLSMLFVFHTL